MSTSDVNTLPVETQTEKEHFASERRPSGGNRAAGSGYAGLRLHYLHQH